MRIFSYLLKQTSKSVYLDNLTEISNLYFNYVLILTS